MSTTLLPFELREALLTLKSRGPGALLDQDAMYALAEAELIEVNDCRRLVLTERGELACAGQTIGK